MFPRVTIGIPIYKRLEFIPQALRVVLAQDYPEIECIVSDNGMNGSKVADLVSRHYSRPYRFRQNPETVIVSEHFNQIVQEATGKYFILFQDDDEMSPNFVSDLVALLERHPSAAVAISKQEAVDPGGRVLRKSLDVVPEILSGEEFVKAWCQGSYLFECFATILFRTEEAKACGGYPRIALSGGNGVDDALLLKLCLGRNVAFSTQCTHRKRTYEESMGFSCDYRSLVYGYTQFFTFLDSDPVIRRYAHSHLDQYHAVKQQIVKMLWKTCFHRWNGMYRERLSPFEWVRSAFAMPFIPEYYAAVGSTLAEAAKAAAFDRGKKLFPWAHRLYRSIKHDAR
ncbi:MAG: glycosyltransferase family A protein [Nitrospira sp.]|nr:glycosyltransferase family A protein [Nitrospira sp.]